MNESHKYFSVFKSIIIIATNLYAIYYEKNFTYNRCNNLCNFCHCTERKCGTAISFTNTPTLIPTLSET